MGGKRNGRRKQSGMGGILLSGKDEGKGQLGEQIQEIMRREQNVAPS